MLNRTKSSAKLSAITNFRNYTQNQNCITDSTFSSSRDQVLTEMEIDKLYERFAALDKQEEGVLEERAMHNIPELQQNPLAGRITAVLFSKKRVVTRDDWNDSSLIIEHGQMGSSLTLNLDMEPRAAEFADDPPPTTIDFTTFCAFLSVFSCNQSRESKLTFAFEIYDVDGDDLISRRDLFIVLKMMVGREMLDDGMIWGLVDETIAEWDEDGDGCLDFEEFTRAMFDSGIEDILTFEF